MNLKEEVCRIPSLRMMVGGHLGESGGSCQVSITSESAAGGPVQLQHEYGTMSSSEVENNKIPRHWKHKFDIEKIDYNRKSGYGYTCRTKVLTSIEVAGDPAICLKQLIQMRLAS